jgi:hypothetical protein
VPNVDASVLKGSAIVCLDYLKGEEERRALLSFSYVAANELRIEIEGAFRSFGRQNANLRARVACLLFCGRPPVYSQNKTRDADPRRSARLAPRKDRWQNC